ncbi:MAG: hypothetical protein NTU73_10530 [Ignavibacteriae bacterium]|nr:hypothetical protein [Ignavibacteriota bacterium]
MVHICLYLRFGETEFDYETIYKAIVTHEGHDCTSPNYYCSYITSGSNPTAMGCYLPWNDYDCHYIRSVCLTTYEGGTYTGSVEFSYPLTEQLWVDLYYNPNVECNFGGIEKNNE